MTTYSLFSHGTPHGTVSSSTGTQFIVGIAFEVTEGGCWLEGYWWYAGGATSPQKFTLWCVTGGTAGGTGSKTGTVVSGSTVTSGTLAANAWNYVALPSPLPLAIGTSYVAATGYVITAPFANASNIFNSTGTYPDGITSGPLFAYNDSAGGGPVADSNPWGGWSQALFAANSGTDPTVTLPAAGSNSGSFGMDVQVSDTDPTGAYAGPYQGWPSNLAANAATVADNNDQYVVATEFWLSEPCTVSAIRYYSPSGASSLCTSADIWRISDQSQQVHVGSPSWSGSAGSGWVQASTPTVTLPAGKYKVSVYNGAGTGSGAGATAKDATTAYWASGKGANDIIWGPLTLPGIAHASTANLYPGPGTAAGQGTFANPTTGPDQYPDDYVSGLGQNYWVDVVVTPATSYSGTGQAAVSLAASAAGSPAKAGTGTAVLSLSAAATTPAAPAAAQQGSWWQLDSVLKERAEYANYYRSIPPVACPNDGEPLREGPPQQPGVLYCRFDGWTYPRDYDPTIHSGM